MDYDWWEYGDCVYAGVDRSAPSRWSRITAEILESMGYRVAVIGDTSGSPGKVWAFTGWSIAEGPDSELVGIFEEVTKWLDQMEEK